MDLPTITRQHAARDRGCVQPRHPGGRAGSRRPAADGARRRRRPRRVTGDGVGGVAGAASYRPGRVARPRRHLRPRHPDARGCRRGSAASSAPVPTGCGSTSPAAPPTRPCCPTSGPALHRVSQRAGVLAYQEEPVLPELREVLAATWPYQTEAITVVDGATDGVTRMLEQVVSYGDRVVLESPGFPPFFDLVEALGAEVVPVALDDVGRHARLAAPGARRAAGRRRAAAARAQPDGRLDHRRAGRAAGAGAAPAARRRCRGSSRTTTRPASRSSPDVTPRRPGCRTGWCTCGRYSKSHGPDLRIAALGGPSSIVDRIVARRMLGPGVDLADGADHPARPARPRRSRSTRWREARRQYMARQRTLVAELGRRWACTSRCPTGSTCGCRCATSAPPCCTCRRPDPGRRRRAVPRVRRGDVRAGDVRAGVARRRGRGCRGAGRSGRGGLNPQTEPIGGTGRRTFMRPADRRRPFLLLLSLVAFVLVVAACASSGVTPTRGETGTTRGSRTAAVEDAPVPADGLQARRPRRVGQPLDGRLGIRR